jgi:pimeloyl-ACP methyl ester carboxylesterase
MNAYPVFKSAESRDIIRSRYNQILSTFPFGQKYIGTAFGKTFLLEAGLPENEPLILLHGSCSNSAFWFGEMMALSQTYHVYAVDIVGEAGNSDDNRLDLNSTAYADWLREVLDALSIQKSVIAGNSLGGWMALKFATAYPERISKLILIASAGIGPVRPKFLSDVSSSRGQNDPLKMNPVIAGEQSIPQEVFDFINLIIEHFNPVEELPLYTDEQLVLLTMPVLSIIGENDVIIDAQQSAQRLAQIVPAAEIHLLPDCGHVILDSLTYIIPFLQKGG